MTAPLLSLHGIGKTFGSVTVLRDVDFAVQAGRVMALVGENGAGKSTLMKIVTGIHDPDKGGEIRFKGQPVRFHTPRQAMDAGIAIIHQELNLLPGLSVAENIFLGREPRTRFGSIDWSTMKARAAGLLARLKQDHVSPGAPLGRMGVGTQQMVEIARALSLDAEVIIMDEPTDALTDVETRILFEVIRSLKAEGKAIVYISHRLSEIFALCDDVTVLRDGQMVHTGTVADLTEADLIRHMVGREITDQYPHAKCPPGKVRLEVKNAVADGVEDVSFTARAGEVVGFAGLMGAGRTELARAIYGANRLQTGTVEVDGVPVPLKSPRDGVRAGIAYVTEDRKADGLIQPHSIRFNMALGALGRLSRGPVVDRRRETSAVAEYMKAFAVKAPDMDCPVNTLSGGNQQKVSLAKSLLTQPKIVILDEPTRGVDVGARREIYVLINKLKEQGLCVLLMSSDMPELLGLSDRILVLSHGRLTGSFDRGQATQEGIMERAVA
ncbi:Ribose ABC transport system, ATP-binding protein RbsA [Caenispirillum salinarum AK4]|uniref:Ribose ABC transport system, ATP-binding protein RbsA n=1 Tax=Caenispirillum salinarum AK4 TaxID=1238182 RepID=K9HCB9_9PROT|nr:sugar ABC transporter ATP-binding protein [Caenispirillum salinarum]EKV28158.1 Ribose ABC transport system, ATP-binding protein RbsA [Caenispirillum salinarum AK4]